jgi:excisionase family DNA binding protein
VTAPQFLTPQELADLLNLPLGTVRAWRHRREGPLGFRCGKHVRYDLAEVLRWVEQQQDGERDGPSIEGSGRWNDSP